MAKLNTAIRGVQIDSAVAGNGLEWDGSENLQADLGNGLEFSGSDIQINLDGSTLALGASGIKLAALTDTYILVGDGSNVATGVVVSGDVAIDNLGEVTIAADAVSNTKLANMTQGTVKVGGASDAPTDLDAKTDGYILIGDGTDLNSVAVSGDVAITNAGVATVTDLTITSEADGDLLYFDGSNWVRVPKTSVNDYVLTQQTNGDLSWTIKASIGEDYIQEAEIQKATYAGDDATVIFSIGSAAVANSVQVFLEGLLQEEGSGNCYTVSGTNVTFATAPEANMIIQIHSIKT